jgi:hypothetical protein
MAFRQDRQPSADQAAEAGDRRAGTVFDGEPSSFRDVHEPLAQWLRDHPRVQGGDREQIHREGTRRPVEGRPPRGRRVGRGLDPSGLRLGGRRRCPDRRGLGELLQLRPAFVGSPRVRQRFEPFLGVVAVVRDGQADYPGLDVQPLQDRADVVDVAFARPVVVRDQEDGLPGQGRPVRLGGAAGPVARRRGGDAQPLDLVGAVLPLEDVDDLGRGQLVQVVERQSILGRVADVPAVADRVRVDRPELLLVLAGRLVDFRQVDAVDPEDFGSVPVVVNLGTEPGELSLFLLGDPADGILGRWPELAIALGLGRLGGCLRPGREEVGWREVEGLGDGLERAGAGPASGRGDLWLKTRPPSWPAETTTPRQPGSGRFPAPAPLESRQHAPGGARLTPRGRATP